MTYIDTSVLAAYYCPEPLSSKAQDAIRKCAKPVISPLVEVELCSAVSLKVRTGDMDAKSAAMVISEFRNHLGDGVFRMVAIEPKEYEIAGDWLSKFTTPLRTMDAIHLAVAFTHKLNLLTADKALWQSAKQLGVTCKFIS